MWEAIEDLYPDEEPASFQGDLLLVFIDSKCAVNLEVQRRVERKAVSLPGGCDLKIAFAPTLTHQELHLQLNITELPAAAFFREGVERERCASVDDVLEFAGELTMRYRSR